MKKASNLGAFFLGGTIQNEVFIVRIFDTYQPILTPLLLLNTELTNGSTYFFQHNCAPKAIGAFYYS